MEKCGVQFVKCHMAGQKNRANAPGLSAKKKMKRSSNLDKEVFLLIFPLKTN